jgi:hypothetical protein
LSFPKRRSIGKRQSRQPFPQHTQHRNPLSITLTRQKFAGNLQEIWTQFRTLSFAGNFVPLIMFGDMKRLLVFAALLVVGYATADTTTNSIDTLVQKLNASNGLWLNGGYPILPVSSNATPQEVVSAAVKMWSVEGGRIKTFRIVEARKIELRHLPGCSAALLESNLGSYILLFRYEKYNVAEGGNWWTRFVAVTEKAEPSGAANPPTPPASEVR